MSQSNKIIRNTAIVNGKAMSVETFNGKLFKIFDDEGNLIEDRSVDFQNESSPPPDVKQNKDITPTGSPTKDSQGYLVKECPECKSASLLPLYLGNSIRYRCQHCDNVFVREIPGSKEQKKVNKNKPIATKPRYGAIKTLKPEDITKIGITTIKPKDTSKIGIATIEPEGDVAVRVAKIDTIIPKIDIPKSEPKSDIPEKQITTPNVQTNIITPDIQTTTPEVKTMVPDVQTTIPETKTTKSETQIVSPDIPPSVTTPKVQTVAPEKQTAILDVQTVNLDMPPNVTTPEVQTVISEIPPNVVIPEIKITTPDALPNVTTPEIPPNVVTPEIKIAVPVPKIDPTVPKIDIIKLEHQKKMSKEVPEKPKGVSISNIKAPVINHPSKIMEEKIKPTDKPVVKTKLDNISKVELPKAEIPKEAPKFEQGKIKKTREARMIDEEEETTEERKFEKWLNKQKFKENVEKMAEIAKENQEEIGGISKEITNVKDGIGDMENKIQVLRDNLQSTLGDTKKPITETLGELCTGVDCIKEDVKKYQDTQSELDKKLDSRFSELRERVQKLEEPTYVCDNCGQDGIKALSSYCPNCGSPIHEWYDDTGQPVRGWAPHWKRTSIRQSV